MKLTSSSGKGDFTLVKENQKIFELKYTNWFSSKARTALGEEMIEIRPQNIWCSKFDIFKQDLDQGDIIFNWKGNIIIRLMQEEGVEKSYLLRAKGFWNQSFELTDEADHVILLFAPSMNWKKLNYNYDVQQISEEYDEQRIHELLIYCGFGANLYMTMMATGVAGAVS